MVVQAIRPDDQIVIEEPEIDRDMLMVVRAKNTSAKRSALVVHFSECSRSYRIADLLGRNEQYAAFRKMDAGTESRIVTSARDATVTFDGPGLAIATTATAGPE
jgi:hypothetical protein